MGLQEGDRSIANVCLYIIEGICYMRVDENRLPQYFDHVLHLNHIVPDFVHISAHSLYIDVAYLGNATSKTP